MRKIHLLLYVLLLAACTTSKNTVEQQIREVHDTLYLHHTDTISTVRVLKQTDTVRIEKERLIVLNQVGDTVKERLTENHYHHESNSDSIGSLRASIDSLSHQLQSLNDKNHETVIVREKKTAPWKIVSIILVIGCVVLFVQQKLKL